MKFQIISDGSCDLKKEFTVENNVEIVPFYVSFDKVTHLKEGIDVEVNDFYQRLVDDENLFPITSTPSIGDYLEVFTKYAKQDIPMICICITSKFSASYTSASNAKVQLLEEYPNAKIEVIDSMINTVLQGLLIKDIIKMRNDNFTLEEAVEKVENVKSTGKLFFTVNSLDYLRNGGRIGKASALIGSILKINPIIVMTGGAISNAAKATSRKRAIAKLKSIIQEEFSDKNVDDYNIVVGYCFICEEIESFRESIAHLLNVDINNIHLETVGATIGVHTGPTAMGFAFVKKYNK